MTDRDAFAAAALTGLLARFDYTEPKGTRGPLLASFAYELADAMLAERKGWYDNTKRPDPTPIPSAGKPMIP